MKRFSELSPCEDCLRPERPLKYNDTADEGAFAYVLINACDTADVDAPLGDKIEQLAVDFKCHPQNLSSNADDERRVKEFVGMCGRAIGRDFCPLWVLNVDTLQIDAR